MTRTKSGVLSLLVVFSLLIGIVGAVNVDVSYAASKRIHLRKTSVTATDLLLTCFLNQLQSITKTVHLV